MLDSDLLLGDCFDHRSNTVAKSQWTVCVRREPPTVEELRLLGSVRFSSISTNSGARPPKRPFGAVSGYHGAEGVGYGPQGQMGGFKRQKSERPDVARAHERDQPVPSLEGDMIEAEHGQNVLVEDSQKLFRMLLRSEGVRGR